MESDILISLPGGTSLSDQAYDIVERMIVTLELAPGAVFSEKELSTRIGIGRTPLREALQRLASERLVAVLPRRGMMVTEINVSQYVALLATRRALDGLIASRAAARVSEDEKQELLELASQIRQSASRDDFQTFMDLDRRGDAILDRAAMNPFAVEAVAPLHAHCRRFWSMYKHGADLGASAELHAIMIEAVASGDADTAVEASDSIIDYLVRFTRSTLELE